MYSVEFSKLAKKQFDKLDVLLRKRVVSALGRIKVRPFSFVERLVGTPHFKLRVGDYRLILQIETGKLSILVLELGHRKKIYKN